MLVYSQQLSMLTVSINILTATGHVLCKRYPQIIYIPCISYSYMHPYLCQFIKTVCIPLVAPLFPCYTVVTWLCTLPLSANSWWVPHTTLVYNTTEHKYQDPCHAQHRQSLANMCKSVMACSIVLHPFYCYLWQGLTFSWITFSGGTYTQIVEITAAKVLGVPRAQHCWHKLHFKDTDYSSFILMHGVLKLDF